jgi:hypothetical protein
MPASLFIFVFLHPQVDFSFRRKQNQLSLSVFGGTWPRVHQQKSATQYFPFWTHCTVSSAQGHAKRRPFFDRLARPLSIRLVRVLACFYPNNISDDRRRSQTISARHPSTAAQIRATRANQAFIIRAPAMESRGHPWVFPEAPGRGCGYDRFRSTKQHGCAERMPFGLPMLFSSCMDRVSQARSIKLASKLQR